ncbi:MAG: PKD domain-containing protein, partial [Flammeovirgaceae bacterium]|nr:PKD domain-containing protein [Flammeovirgaceae bacterium]MDW8287573.1 PKD domain-containing protein [Flammeovirgaceae bacterium]
MKKILLFGSLVILAVLAKATEPPTTTIDAIHFIENKGQWDERVTHRVRVPQGNLYFHRGGFTYDFLESEFFHHHHEKEHDQPQGYIVPTENEATQERIAQQLPSEFITAKAHALKVTFQDYQENYQVVGKDLSSAYYNFYYGNDEKKWVHQARAYGGIRYEGIYKGIDFQMRQFGEGLKYEFFVAPHVQPEKIRMRYEGAEKMYLENGQLKIFTSVITLIEYNPIAFQIVGGDTVYVDCRFRLKKNEVSFEFPKGYHSEYPLIIDPLLAFSTYSGSFADNWGFTATYDTEGNLYAGGIVMDNRQFPITSGAYQAVFRGGISDVSIIKYNKNGTNIIYATYLGGSNVEVPTSMVVNSRNELIVLGITGSNNFPVTTNAPFPFFRGGSDITPIGGIQYNNGSDLFISRFSNDGTALLGSTYLGGSANDGINTPNSYVQGNNFQIVLNLNYGDEFKGEVVVDDNDNIYIASCTYSTNFPVNGFKITNSGNEEGVVVKFNSTLSSLLWSTYVGGTFSDAAYSLRVHNSRVYVVGATRSNNMDMGGSGFDKTFNGGVIDGFAYVLNANTSSLLASTYLGTDQIDEAYHVDIDNEGNPIIAGLTFGSYPITSGTYNNPSSGQFIHGLNSSLVTTLFSTRIGANTSRPAISITAFSVDKCGNIYLAGWGGATNTTHIGGSTSGMPITSNAIQANTDGSDFYIAMFSKNATRLLYGTFLGHISSSPLQEHVDGGTSRFSPEGIVYQSVCSCGTTAFPTTPGVWSNFNRATLIGDPTVLRCNIASFKFELEKLKSSFTVSQSTGCAPLTINFRSTSENAIKLTWDMGDGKTFTNLTNFNYTYSQPGTYIVKLTAESDFICTPDVFQQTITIHPRNNMSVSTSS